jgi:hypothetical protein
LTFAWGAAFTLAVFVAASVGVAANRLNRNASENATVRTRAVWTRAPDLNHRDTHVTSFRIVRRFDTCREDCASGLSLPEGSYRDGENASFLLA